MSHRVLSTIFVLLLMILSVATGTALAALPSMAGPVRWDDVEVIVPQGEQVVIAPDMVADSAGDVHLVWQQSDRMGELQDAIFYSRWDGDQWSLPVDVLISPSGSVARDPAIAVDSDGFLHVIWSGAQLFYSHAHVTQADRSSGWSEPLPIAGNSIFANITIDDRDIIHVIYPHSGGDVYYIQSIDGGVNWSPPFVISRVSNREATDSAGIAVDSLGVLHAIWTEYPLPEAYPPNGVYYARSENDGRNWTSPVLISRAREGMGSIIIDPDGRIHIVWDGDAETQGRYHRWSGDGGQTWTQPTNITGGHAGLVGPPSLALDSSGNLHMMVADKYRENTWTAYSTWSPESGWSRPENVALPDEVYYGERVAMTIALGNQVHVAVPANFDSLWTRNGLIPIPGLEPAPVPPLAQPDIQPIPTTPAASSPEADEMLPLPVNIPVGTAAPDSPTGTSILIFSGAGAAILLIIVVVISHLPGRRARR